MVRRRLKKRWLVLLVGVFLLADYLEDGTIDGAVLRGIFPLHLPVVPMFGLNKVALGNWVRVKKTHRGRIDYKETGKRMKRKEHHHKHESGK